MKKYKIGYTQGTYDLFHIGHLNLLKNAKEQCEYLIVGINTDRLVKEYKNKNVVISEQDRAKIVESIKFVDEIILTDTLDKKDIANKIKFNVIFIGSDWENNKRWIETKKDMKKIGIDVVFLPHTDGISSTDIRAKINNTIYKL
jgi:cytidyltransferase-related domain